MIESNGNIILNGCSFVEGNLDVPESTLSYHLEAITGKPIINLGKSGANNERIFRTTFNFLEENQIRDSFIVIGLTHWARFELYDEGLDKYHSFNFWDNSLLKGLEMVINYNNTKYLEYEFKFALIKNPNFKKYFSTYTKQELIKAIMFYLTIIKNKKAEVNKIKRELILLESYCEKFNNKLFYFNSLECLPNLDKENYIKIGDQTCWYDYIEKQNMKDDIFTNHPNSQSNKQVANLIKNSFEIYN